LKLSVAMCTYNGARYVGEQLASMAAQTLAPGELVVCDDRSTDETADIVREFASRAPFPVRYHLNEENLGSTKNFERAVTLCEGEVIVLSDQDDVWVEGKLERMEAEFARSPRVGLVFTDAEVVDESLRPLGYTIWQSLGFDARKREAFGEGAAFESLLTQNVVTGAAMAFRSSFRGLVLPLHETIVRRYGMPEWNLIHDGWIALLIAAAAEVVPVAEPLLKYRQHPRQQLGINAPRLPAEMPVAGWRARADTQYKEYFVNELELLGTVRERLAERCGEFDCAATLAELEARMSHMRARASLPSNRLRRAPLVFREFLTMRYFRYSNGVSSAAKDILL
jgi:glycosyltransferase involved in cell wall biosynthesis